MASEGGVEPLIGRKKELLQLMRTLERKSKNNPLLLGEPGVGKSALVPALAVRIAEGNVVGQLKGKRIIEINLGALVAGTKYRGEFEERITKLLAEIRVRPEVILFLDEIHTMVGAGSAEGALDAANLLKPALSQGGLTCIGSTTLVEYRRHFEKDGARARRFQPIIIGEPSAEETVQILEGLVAKYQEHHKVRIAPSALRSAVELSARFIPDRRLPDKALDLLDESRTRVKVGSVTFRADGANQPEPAVVTGAIVARVVTE
jgi:ATP-dependent Clp protease ATP-binding subunit ClpC